MLSEIFDNSDKGEKLNDRRTICEVHREIYDLVVIHLQGNKKALSDIIPKLEEVFLMGVKMNLKMIEKKCEIKGWEKNMTLEQSEHLRNERIRLAKILVLHPTARGKPGQYFV